ncbi:dTDP-glucose 4,6-dehydratase [Actinoalloteichus hymeniacidonis]|uniref:NAD-dependent epimerase/dehydratase family protein n=2 Tax=Actinoalloteichus hymeniacidonis TaxID=340345 RepID=UPI0009FFF91C|nr:NAD-dependent epimerase/dehydratase family protein [Actinoalloteichus hymeniacidonis]MBB5907221.1 dTDP-glucose 4,6-dehydratase [Actinoalloteichus hymeniacidonis]
MTRRIERALVTGGMGFVGSHLCELLLAEGSEVLILDNLVTAAPGTVAEFGNRPNLRVDRQDVTEPITTPGPFDVVFHLASAASPQDYLRLPIETLRAGSLGTTHALDVALRDGARFVLASTSEVYGDPAEHPQRESYWGHVNPIGPRSVYDEAKRYAEALTNAYRGHRGANTGIARIFNTYGPRMRPDDGRMVPTFIRQALAGLPMTVTGDGAQTRSLCYVADTARGLLALGRSDHPGPINLGNPVELSVGDLAAEVRSAAGSESPVTFVEAAEDDPRRRCPDITLARRQLSWRPEVALADGLRRTIDWFEENTGIRAAHPA